MAIPMSMPPTLLPATQTTLYTVPDGVYLQLDGVHLMNTAPGTVTVNLHAVPSGGAVGDDNALLSGFVLAAKGILEFGNGMKFPPGCAIIAYASPANVASVYCSGWKVMV
jgi:hypothetical protein